MTITQTSLMLNPNGSIYHLSLFPEELAPTILLVGDPMRVELISRYFDVLEVQKKNREFLTHTGTYQKKRLSIIGTGIGTGNIDIVINEADALANIDFLSRTVKQNITPLTFIRLGTCGALRSDIPLNAIIASSYAVGLDGLMNYYRISYNNEQKSLLSSVKQHFHDIPTVMNSYLGSGSRSLCEQFNSNYIHAMTLTLGGFYGPQARSLRAPTIHQNIMRVASTFSYQDHYFANFEMETAAIYGLCNILGHHSCSLSTVVANRATEMSSDNPVAAMKGLIERVLEFLKES